MTKYVLLLLLAISLASKAPGKDLNLANTFSDGIVLQRGKPINVWGHASPEQPVTLKFGEETKIPLNFNVKFRRSYTPPSLGIKIRNHL